MTINNEFNFCNLVLTAKDVNDITSDMKKKTITLVVGPYIKAVEQFNSEEEVRKRLLELHKYIHRR